MLNVQQRSIAAPPAIVGALVDRLGGPDDVLWPSTRWPALRLDAGLTIGSKGGHGPIRYAVGQYEPGHRLRLLFDPRTGLLGHHEFVIAEDGAGSRITHTIRARTSGLMLLFWPLAVRWMHDALLQDLLDNAERESTGSLSGVPSRWSPWVRVLRRVLR